jgi:hypothetical protein
VIPSRGSPYDLYRGEIRMMGEFRTIAAAVTGGGRSLSISQMREKRKKMSRA